jgi:hypothetical protein
MILINHESEKNKIMKLTKHISGVLAICVALSSLFIVSSCEETGDGMNIETPDGPATINYIRLTNPASADSLLVSASLGTGIAIVGKTWGVHAKSGSTIKKQLSIQHGLLTKPFWLMYPALLQMT